ncbi:MAG: CRTAC1 family protein [Vicinamibacterales bacterium]
MSPRRLPVRLVLPLVGFALYALAAVPATNDPPFALVQPGLHTLANTYSNAWGDVDNDGDVDLAVSTQRDGIRLFRNDAGTLVSVGASLGLPEANYELRGVSWGDYDGDGFIDLLAGPIEKNRLSLVFHNDGGRHFTEVGAAIGLTMPNRSARQTNFVDLDNDGDLDVYATDRAGANQVYRNDGGRFTQAFVGQGVSDVRASVGSCWFDYDSDGDLDVFLANQAGAADALWRNDGATFTDVAPALGLTGPHRTAEEGGVGCAVGDYDNDGDFDLFVANYGRSQLYRNNGDGSFTDVAPAVHLDVENHAVSADWGDFDNDGDLDLSIMSYDGPAGQQQPKDALFRNDGAQGFVNVIDRTSPLNRGDHGTQFVDVDGDGGLDLSITDGYSPEGGHFLFHNTLPAEAKARSLAVLVLDAQGHFTQVGAEVRVFDARGRVLASRQVVSGGGYNSQRTGPVHVGLTSLAPVTVEVTFMGQKGRTTQRVPGIRPADYARKPLIVRRTAQ